MTRKESGLVEHALEKIEARAGSLAICCGCFLEGHPGDGYFQPPDGPMCCQQQEEDVASVCADIRQHLTSLQSAAEGLEEALYLALNSHGRLLMSDPPQEAWKFHNVDAAGRAALAAFDRLKEKKQ